MRYLEELTDAESLKVYENNRKLRELIFNDYYAVINECWLSEYLSYFENSVMYEIDYDNGHNYFTVKEGKELDFLDRLKALQEHYGFLAESYNDDIEVLERLIGIELDFDLDYRYNKFRVVIDDLTQNLERACLDRLLEEYEPLENESDLRTYFLEFFLTDIQAKTYFVDENYILYRQVVESFQ